MERDAAHLEMVLALGERLCRSRPFVTGAGEICTTLAHLAGARGLALFASDDIGDELTLLGAAGLPDDYLRRFPVGGRCVLGHLTGDLREALVDREPVRVDSIADDPWTVSLNSVALKGGFSSTYAVPLLFEDRVVGAFHAFYAGGSDPSHRRQLIRVGAIVASSLARTEARKATSRYPVEGLRRMRAEDEIERYAQHLHAAAERYGQIYSVVVYALDRPEILARRYGDSVAHEGVSGLLTLIDNEIRAADLTGRHGEAGCVVIMPGTDPEGAFRQCERVLTRFGQVTVRTDSERLQLSASAGISFFPENGAISLAHSIRSAYAALLGGLGHDKLRIIAIAPPGSANK